MGVSDVIVRAYSVRDSLFIVSYIHDNRMKILS